MKRKQALRICDVLQSLLPRVNNAGLTDVANWPPDVFAVAGYLLYTTGIYRKAICNIWWKRIERQHLARLIADSEGWRVAAASSKSRLPQSVRKCWNEVLKAAKLPLREIETHRHLVTALFDLVALADVACDGMGLPHPNYSSGDPDLNLLKQAENLLMESAISSDAASREPSSLCKKVDPEVLSVLPKMHTPQVGLTFRSLTHNLALCPRDEITPIWNYIESPLSRSDSARFNLLLVPIPDQIETTQFAAISHTRAGRHRMPTEYRSFTFDARSRLSWLNGTFRRILTDAKAKTTENVIHGVVFPELSLASREEFLAAYESLQKVCPSAFLVAGVSGIGTDGGGEKKNHAYFAIPQGGGHMVCTQAKHHKWRITQNQIQNYKGLGQVLDAGRTWWEHIEIEPRQINFFALKQWFTLGFIICEDLARQEPASRLLRAVGPSLVVALLMDGEQAASRWPARYATVLAEDPGSSVLTITSRGMADLGAQVYYKKKRPSALNIAMWRDSENQHIIEIKDKSAAVLLSLEKKVLKEYSIDGRKADISALVINNGGADIIQIPAAKRKTVKKKVA